MSEGGSGGTSHHPPGSAVGEGEELFTSAFNEAICRVLLKLCFFGEKC